MTYYIKADQFFYPHHVRKGGFLAISDGKFGNWTAEVPENAEILDYSGKSIAPGLVDTHIHGFGGADVQDSGIEGIMGTMSEGLLSAGVTSFLPTPLTDNFEHLKALCEQIGNHYQEAKGAKIRGIHFEGPFFTEPHKGAQNPKYMRDPSVKELDEWLEASHGLLKKVDIAPERDGALEFVAEATKRDVKIFLGHSDALYEEAIQAVEAGASGWVHAFNGMRGLTHREPGMVGAILNTSDTVAEVICDGLHVRPEAVKLLIDKKGTDHVALITDSMRAAGFDDGEYKLGEYTVTVRDGAAWLPTGNLAASILKLKDAVKNVVDWQIVTPAEAVKMGSLIPAKSVNIDDVCGQIKTGLDADFIVLDEQLELVATYLDGEKRYEA